MLIDISPVISESTAVFPGDCPFKQTVALSFENGDHFRLSSIESTVHIGAHTDAPNHYDKAGEDIASRDLKYYYGACQVIDCTHVKKRSITEADLGTLTISTQRVLFKTDSFPNPNLWNGDFVSISHQLIEFLADQGVLLIGIDTPSIDPSDSKSMLAHSAVAKHNMAILEGVVLTNVSAGSYKLIALPLKIRGADASPVRAVLESDNI